MTSVDGFSIPHTVLHHFDLTSTPYTEAFNEDIAERRRTYPDGALFLDQLLGLASIDGPSSYPPTTPAALRRLIYTIRSAQIDRLKQDCFLYYLLLDYDHHASLLPNGHSEDSTERMNEDEGVVMRLDKGKGKERVREDERADEFARKRCLPQMWRGFISGYWALDHGLWEDAVQALSDPAITSLNFLPAIFTLLSTHVSPPSRSLSLMHTLFTALAPQLETERMVTLRTISLAHASLSNAFNFLRVRPISERPKLREDLWLWALGSPRIPLGQGPSSIQPTILTQLLHLPLIPEESTHLLSFLTHPPRSLTPQALDLLHELITVRMIHQGQYAECLALDKELAGSQAGNQEDRQKRRERVKEFIAILPEAQRRVLEMDGEERRGEVLQNGVTWNGAMEMDVDMPSTDSRHITSTPAPIIAPAPTRLPSLLSLTNGHTPSHPSSPAIRNLTPSGPGRNISSPFSGPPQFARNVSNGITSTPNRSSPINRLVSGSPFQPPRPQGVVDVPRPGRRIIDDDADEEEEEMFGKRRSTRSRQVTGRQMSSTPAKRAIPASDGHDEVRAEVDNKGDKADENNDDNDETANPYSQPNKQNQNHQDTAEMPPPPVPSTTKSRSTRPAPVKSTQKPSRPTPSLPPPSPTTSTTTTTTRSTRRQSTVPPESPGLSGPMPGSFTSLGVPAGARSRITRSASRAVLDEDQPDPGPTPKKAKTSASVQGNGKGKGKGKAREASQAPSDGVEESVRRSTRRGTREASVVSSVGGRSRRGGSPTPSVASTARSGRQGSATPRAARARK